MKQQIKGLIALDIDGTVTAVRDHLNPQVVEYLAARALEGWQLYFITGRTFHWAHALLKDLPFSYIIGAHNGAYICSMPDQTVLYRGYLEKNDVLRLAELLKRFNSTGVIYTGPDGDERTYVCPHDLSEDKYKYMSQRRIAVQEVWIEVDSVHAIPDDMFLAVRCLEKRECALKISEAIASELQLSSPLMMDSCGATYMLVQITKKEVTKGTAISHVVENLNLKGPIIAAGDDHNDVAMLQNADIKIAMATAPQELLDLADVIAPPAAECGIIKGLEMGFSKIIRG